MKESFNPSDSFISKQALSPRCLLFLYSENSAPSGRGGEGNTIKKEAGQQTPPHLFLNVGKIIPEDSFRRPGCHHCRLGNSGLLQRLCKKHGCSIRRKQSKRSWQKSCQGNRLCCPHDIFRGKTVRPCRRVLSRPGRDTGTTRCPCRERSRMPMC